MPGLTRCRRPGLTAVVLSACLTATCTAAKPLPRPQDLFKTLDKFYKKQVSADGLLIASSEKVSDYALREAAYLIRHMLKGRDDVREALIRARVRVGVMAYNEMTTAIPEHRKLSVWYDKRARGLGGNPVTCGEENLLGFKGDPYRGESILIHEFAHIIHGRGLNAVDKGFDTRLNALYEKMKASGRYRGYAMVSYGELWAEGVQSWFHCNRGGGLDIRKPDGKRLSHIHTREQMKTHAPELAQLLAESFKGNDWTYVPVLERLHQPHLKGYDPAKAPVFRWPKRVIEGIKRIEAERRRKRRRKKTCGTMPPVGFAVGNGGMVPAVTDKARAMVVVESPPVTAAGRGRKQCRRSGKRPSRISCLRRT